jgi:hypothetical protein
MDTRIDVQLRGTPCQPSLNRASNVSSSLAAADVGMVIEGLWDTVVYGFRVVSL